MSGYKPIREAAAEKMTLAALEGRAVSAELEYAPAEPTGRITVFETTGNGTHTTVCNKALGMKWPRPTSESVEVTAQELTSAPEPGKEEKLPSGNKDPETEAPPVVYGGVCPCPKCHAMTYPGQEHTCPAIGLSAVPPKEWTRPGPDRNLVWDDCPQCALKHLTACYSSLTAADLARPEVPTSEIYVARAVIAIRESRMGYPGNLALAVGCLAQAECLNEEEAESYRAARMELMNGMGVAELHFLIPRPGAFAAAHFTEALREFPALADRIQVTRFYGPNGFCGGRLPEALEVIRANIAWLTKSYELLKGEQDGN